RASGQSEGMAMATPILILADVPSLLGGVVLGLVVGAAAVFVLVKVFGGQTLARAKSEAELIRKQASDEAKTITEKATLEAERQVLERKEKFEEEAEAIRKELRENERRLTKREDLLDKKLDSLSSKEERLTQ